MIRGGFGAGRRRRAASRKPARGRIARIVAAAAKSAATKLARSQRDGRDGSAAAPGAGSLASASPGRAPFAATAGTLSFVPGRAAGASGARLGPSTGATVRGSGSTTTALSKPAVTSSWNDTRLGTRRGAAGAEAAGADVRWVAGASSTCTRSDRAAESSAGVRRGGRPTRTDAGSSAPMAVGFLASGRVSGVLSVRTGASTLVPGAAVRPRGVERTCRPGSAAPCPGTEARVCGPASPDG